MIFLYRGCLVDEIPTHKISVDEMYVDKMSVDKGPML
jgi:hypothetical protein